MAIARALAIEPTFLLADEPTGNLDSANSQRVMTLLRKLVDTHQQTIVLVTHDPAVAALADRVIHLSDGQIEREEILRPKVSVGDAAGRNGEWRDKPAANPQSAIRTPHEGAP